MTNEQNTKRDALVPSNERGLITPHSTGLARRGLELAIAIDQVGEIRRFVGHEGWVVDAKFSPDDRHIISASLDHTARLWNIQDGEEIARFVYSKSIKSVAFGPDGQHAVLGCSDGSVFLWDVYQEVEEKKSICIYVHDEGVLSVAFSHNGRFVASGGRDNQFYVCMIEPGLDLNRFNGHTDVVSSIDFSPDDRYILSGSHDGTVRIWKAGGEHEIRCFYGPGKFVTSAVFSPDGKYILSGHGEHRKANVPEVPLASNILIQPALEFSSEACLWDIEEGCRIRSFDSHASLIESVAFSRDGRLAATAARDKTIRLWDVESGVETYCFKEQSYSFASSVDFSHNGRFVASGERDGTVRLWKLPSQNV